MNKVMGLIGTVGVCIVMFRGIVGITDDICKFINRRKEAKDDNSVDEHVSGSDTSA